MIVFVSATGTEIGKTFVSCGLIRALRARGRAVAAHKPVVSGYDPAQAAESDPGRLLAALDQPVTPAAIAEVSPWRFSAPLSPDAAARAEGRTIDVASVIAFCRAAADRAETTIIEGIGGVMVPLDERHTVLDWIDELRCPVILVAGSYLGTLSHTFTALEVLARRACPVAAVVVSETPGSTVPLQDVVDTVRRFAPALPVLSLPRLPAGSFDHPVFGELADRA